MADPINATAILAAAQAQAVENAAPTDQSLNAGAFLPSEPVPDVINFEVEGDPSVIREMLPKLDQAPIVAAESHFNTLSYLRDDLLTQRGMNQRIATEAMAILPHFGGGRPINHYSKHVSQTGYQIALESIDEGMGDDVAGQLEDLAQRLTVTVIPAEDGFSKEVDFKRRADQVSMMAHILGDFVRVSTDNGFNWDDQTFRGCAVDPSQNVAVPFTLTQDKQQAYSFATMDAYYMAHLQGPVVVEAMTLYVQAWTAAVQAQMETDKTVEIPKAPTITFSGKTVAIENVQDVFRTAYENQQSSFDDLTTHAWLTTVGNAAEQAKVQDITLRLPDLDLKFVELGGTLRQAAEHVKANPSAATAFNQLVTKLTPVINTIKQGHGELTKFCVNAALATTYAGTLGIKVMEHAWKSVHQCKDTLQMPEAAYNELKCLVEEMQRPQTTNVI